MFRQKLKTSFQFLGILSMRVLLGFVAGILWLAFVAFISRNMFWIVEKFAYRYMDGSYQSIAEAAQRYERMSASANNLVDIVAWPGAWICLAVGVIWGFSQGKLNLWKRLRQQHP